MAPLHTPMTQPSHPSAPTPPTPPAGYSRRRRLSRSRSAGTAAIIVGSVILGSGFLTALSGGVLLGMFGDGQVLGSAGHTITTSGSAIVADLGQIDDLSGFEFLTGSPTLHLSAENVTDVRSVRRRRTDATGRGLSDRT